ncbi:MAG: chromosome segregation protein SMC, partial [Methylotenera sp.]|nr:chromosome segregation protein SMC [Methylotenera sp.]
HLLEAEVSSLTKIQQSMRDGNNEATLTAWLKRSGLNDQARIWQAVRIQSGWETAFEAILGARLNAITHHELPVENRPPAALSLALTAPKAELDVKPLSLAFTSLYSRIDYIEPNHQAVLHDWLTGAYLLEGDADAISASQMLNNGECLVNKQGDIYTRHSVTYFGAQSLLHGVLERQTRLEQLEQQLPEAQKHLVGANNRLVQSESALQQLRANQHLLQQQLKTSTQQAHQLNLNLQQLKQQQSNAMQRQKSLQTDCVLAEEKLSKLQDESSQKENLVGEIAASLTQLQIEKSSKEADKQAAEVLLNEVRQQLQIAERAQQEKSFNIKLIQNNINELNSKLEFLHEEKISLKLRCSEAETTLAATKMEALKANLEVALNAKQQHELALTHARNAMSDCEAVLQQQERSRLQHEQLLHPLRDKLEASRLNEQEARLHFEQCQAELTASNIDESLLANHLSQSMGAETKVADLEKKKSKLEGDIESLGAVNLAAIEELASEQTRKDYLDSQCRDLLEASQTLEDAIRKIDRET